MKECLGACTAMTATANKPDIRKSDSDSPIYAASSSSSPSVCTSKLHFGSCLVAHNKLWCALRLHRVWFFQLS